MSEKTRATNDDLIDAAFLGFVVAAGLGFIALPVCVLLNVHPALWGSFSMGAMPLGAAIGAAIRWASDEEDEPDDLPPREVIHRAPAPPITYDPSTWTGRAQR